MDLVGIWLRKEWGYVPLILHPFKAGFSLHKLLIRARRTCDDLESLLRGRVNVIRNVFGAFYLLLDGVASSFDANSGRPMVFHER